MSDSRSRESIYVDSTQKNPIEMDSMRSEVAPRTSAPDLNSNLESAFREGEKKGLDSPEHEGISLPSSEYSNVKGDLLMRHVYAMPPAGIRSPQNVDQSPSARNYKMASDIFGTGMDKSWSASPGSPGSIGMSLPNAASANLPSPRSPNFDYPETRNAPRSFKITEMASNESVLDEPAGGAPAGRKARESNGNPLTGQGFDQQASKTGKRYFEGSNANQKLW